MVRRLSSGMGVGVGVGEELRLFVKAAVVEEEKALAGGLKKVPIMGDDESSGGQVAQDAHEPLAGGGVKTCGGFVEE